MTERETLELADRFFTAIPKGDAAALRQLYAPDAVIWHNFDQKSQSVEENLRVLAWIGANVKSLRYEEIRRIATPDGWVQQHVLRGIAPNGQPLEVPACIVFRVRAGRVARVEEYLDTAQVAALRG